MEMDIGSSVIALTFAGAKDQTHSDTKWLLSPSTSHFVGSLFSSVDPYPFEMISFVHFHWPYFVFLKKWIKPGQKVCRGCHLFKHMFVFSAQTKSFQKCPAIPLMKLALNGNFYIPKCSCFSRLTLVYYEYAQGNFAWLFRHILLRCLRLWKRAACSLQTHSNF